MINDRYSFRKQVLNCEQILSMIDDGSLQLVDYRYNANTKWSKGLKSLFIYHLLTGIQIPYLKLDGSHKTWYPIAGERQLKTICEFVKGSFSLDLRLLDNNWQYSCYRDLPLFLKRKLLNTEFYVSVLNPGIDSSSRFAIYEMECISSGINDLWPVVKIVFPDSYQGLVNTAEKLAQEYPKIGNKRILFFRIILLWKIRNHVKELSLKDSISNNKPIDALLLPLLSEYKFNESEMSEMINDCWFLNDDSVNDLFSIRTSLKYVVILLLFRKEKATAHFASFSDFIKKCQKIWNKQSKDLRKNSYMQLADQLAFMNKHIMK